MMRQFLAGAAAAAALALSGCASGGGGDVGSEPTCGGIAGMQCASGSYCKMPAGQCRAPDASGYCAQKPQVCSQQYAPVCGCNGETYGNACQAAVAGVSVAYKGECEASGS